MRSPATLAAILTILLSPTFAAAQPPPIPLVGGVWEVKIKSTHFGPDGTKTAGTLTALVTIDQPISLEGGGLTMGAFSSAIGTVLFPETSGSFFADYFVTSAPGATVTASFRANATTGEVKSFKGNATLDVFDGGGGVVVATLTGKRLGATLAVQVIFSEDFETGLSVYEETDPSGALATTLWHAEGFCAAATAIPASMETGAAAYNQGDLPAPVYNYNPTPPAANAGALQAPAVAVPIGSRGIEFAFDTIRQAEAGASFDISFLEARRTGDVDWTSLVQIITQVGCAGIPQTVTVGFGKKSASTLFGTSFEHRFRFDTGDQLFNNYLGWYVDNVEIRSVP